MKWSSVNFGDSEIAELWLLLKKSLLEWMNPRDAQRDASWEEARKQKTEHMEINEAAA
jgi:hypothetical protein